MMIQHFEITQRGESHIRDGSKCQDSSGYAEVALGRNGPCAGISIVADGVGSCAFSDEGSRLAVDTALAFLKQKLAELEKPKDDEILALIRKAFEAACEAIDRHSRGKYPVMEMATTLTLALYAGDGTTYIGHIGDSGIVAMYADGEYKMVTTRHKGEASNSVFTLYEPASTGRWEFKRLEKPVAALALMTDGVLDNCVDREKLDSRVYFPFVARALTKPCRNAGEAAQEQEFWDAMFHSAAWRKRINDDISFCMVQNPDMVSALPEITFDEEAWKRKTRQVREEEEKALSAGSAAQQQLLNRKKAAPSAPGKRAEPKPQPTAAKEKPAAKTPAVKPGKHSRKRTDEENDALFSVKADSVSWCGWLMLAVCALLFTGLCSAGLCLLFPNEDAFLCTLSFAASGILGLAVAYLVFRSLYCPRAAAPDGRMWFWRSCGIAVLGQVITATLVFMLVYGMWYLLVFPAILLFAVALLMLGL